jgi:hypothetical protein
MGQFRKSTNSRSLAAASLTILVLAVYVVWRGVLPPFGDIPGDIGDTRFNLYVLEHGFQWVSGQSSLWHMDFFYPLKGVGSFSDMHLGSLIFYVIPRAVGFDLYYSLQIWLLFGLYGTLFSAYFAARWMKYSLLESIVAAFVFTCALPLTAQVTHIQTVHRWAIPWAVAATMSMSRQIVSRRNNIYVILVAICMQFLISPGSAIATIYICFAIWIALVIFNSSTDDFPKIKLKKGVVLLSLPIVIFAGYAASRYSQFKSIYGISRERYETLLFSPTLKSFLLSDHSAIWKTISYKHSAIDIGRPEIQLFLGLGIIVLVLFGFLRSFAVRSINTSLLFASIIASVGIIKFGEWSFFTHVQIIPGFDSVRTPGRFILVMLFPIGLVAGSSFRRLANSKSAMVKSFSIALLTFVFFEYSAVDLKSVSRLELGSRTEIMVTRVEEKLEKMEGGRPDAFLVFDDGEQSSAIHNFESMKDLDAMFASFKVDLPTLNGYSGFFPFGSYRITNCEDVDMVFAEIKTFSPNIDLSNILLIGGECD